jgi:hypothetical protein
MRIAITMADLHSPLFMEGSNLGNKIGKGQPKQPIVIEYDTELLSLLVHYKGLVALVPHASVASMTVANPKDIGVELPPKVTPPNRVHIVDQSSPAQHLNPMAGPAPLPRNPAQVDVPTQPKVGRKTA